MLSFSDISRMIDRAEMSSYVVERRDVLREIADLAAQSKVHTQPSRARLKQFRTMLEAVEQNDELEVSSQIFIEMAMFAAKVR